MTKVKINEGLISVNDGEYLLFKENSKQAWKTFIKFDDGYKRLVCRANIEAMEKFPTHKSAIIRMSKLENKPFFDVVNGKMQKRINPEELKMQEEINLDKLKLQMFDTMIDNMCDVNGVASTIKMLLDNGFDKEHLIKMNFDIDDIEKVINE